MTLINAAFLTILINGLLIVVSSNSNSTSVIQRRKRNLLFTPRNNIVQLILGTGVPIPLEDQQAMTIGWVLKAAYATPNNASVFTNPYVTFQKRSISSQQATRFDIYRFLDSVFEILGGKGCVLRAICDASQTPFRASSLAGHIMHIIFSPSSTNESPISSSDHEYLGAARMGSDQQINCDVVYPECSMSPLDILTMTA